ncbi:Choline/ethanolaminephosphotransferase [Backusella circina FSU 941]|nr:Choline/ethanolaminephosphotransferase [Backusella circina FSU 941]
MVWSLFSYKEYLREEKIENLRAYKYAATDKSFISRYILKHYWDFAIKLFPRWIAPNLITLIGLFFMIANVIIIGIWLPDLGTEGPSWIYFSFAAGLWLYSTFDNVDGRQARRTGTSSPLGELFDHGCDAINCTYVALLQAAALGLGHSMSAAVLLFVTIVGFYFSTAEEYYTGVLYLGYVNGPTEGIIVTCLAFLWSGFKGAASWHVPVAEISFLSWAHFPSGTTFADLFVWGMIVFFLVTHLPVCLYSIYQACKEKEISSWVSFNNILSPIIIQTFILYLWLSSNQFTLFKDSHFILFAVYIGLLFGEMASDIILAHLTKSEFPHFRGLYLLLVIVPTIYRIQMMLGFHLEEYVILYFFCGLAILRFMVRAVKVINAFCDFLDIRCLVIRKKTPILPTITTTSEEEAESLLVAPEGGANSGYNTF